MIYIKSLIIYLWILLALISLSHLYTFWDGLIFSTRFLGVIAWLTILITLVFLSRRFIKQAFLIFLLFFSLGYFLGPYLEPPADPIDHLKYSYSFCEKNSKQMSKVNKGFWHYNMSSNFLCSAKESTSPEVILRRIDALHGVYWGLLMVGLFILSKSAGLPDRWAFLSIIIAFFFFGTNKFSYFSYYSFGPTFTSLLIYWVWTAIFFFKKNLKSVFVGLVMAVISIPILFVNHVQEAAFMIFIASIWLIWNVNDRIWHWLRNFRVWVRPIYIMCLFLLLFAVVQVEYFQNLISQISFLNAWQDNQEVVIFWEGFHVMGKMWSYRVNDTLGMMGIIPILLCVAFIWPKLIRVNGKMKVRIFILGIIPFVICFVPVFHFIWVLNCKVSNYYRLCYSSIFWLPIGYFLYGLEGRFLIYWKKIRFTRFSRYFKSTEKLSFKIKYFTVCLAIVIMISGIRSGPVYGKLDFILLETKPWWNEWRPMIEDLMKQKGKPIYSDALTSNVLKGVFNQPIATRYQWKFRGSNINVKDMDKLKVNKKYRCIINLHGFNPSWVSKETHHWPLRSANTSLYYQYDGISGEELKRFLKENPPKKCKVYF